MRLSRACAASLMSTGERRDGSCLRWLDRGGGTLRTVEAFFLFFATRCQKQSACCCRSKLFEAVSGFVDTSYRDERSRSGTQKQFVSILFDLFFSSMTCSTPCLCLRRRFCFVFVGV